MKKLNKLFAILIAVLGVQTLSAQTDVTNTYLTNAGFETDGHQTGIKVPTGWTLGTTSGGYTSYRPISDTSTPNGSLPISNGVTAGASEGSCYLYMRTNWGASVCELTQTTQVLPAGKYKLMVDVALPQTQTSRLRTLTIKVTGSTSGTTNSVECCYNPSIWSTVCIPFEVSTEETVVISLYHNDTSGGCGDGVLTAVDNVRLLSYDYAALTSALTEAETLYDSSKEGATELNTAMNTAKSLTESSDKSNIASAAEALLNALDTYKQVQFVVPSSTDYTSWIANAQLETTTGGTIFSSKANMWNSNVPSNWFVTRAVNGNMNATTFGSGQSGKAFEIWATDANTVIGTFFQPISGLPAGKYTLKGYLQNSGKLFVTNGTENTEYSSSPSSTGSWQQFSVTFVKKSASDNLIIGAQTTAAQHFIVDGFSLECIGLDLLKLTSQRDGLVSDLEALQFTLPTTYYSNTVATAIETANAADTESTLTAAINNLSSILTTANSISDAYKQLKRLIDLCSEYTDPQHSNANSDEVLSTFNEAINTATTNGNAATTVDAINIVYSTLEGARQTYAKNAVPVYPYPFDMTFLLPNTTFDSNIDGWTKTGGANWMSAGKNVECYNTTFEFSMEYTGLNSGSWEIQVDAFYRYGGYNNAEAAHNGGTEQLHAILYANNNTVKVKSIMEGANKAGSVGAITKNGVRVPDAPAHCDAYFATGCYANAIATVIADGKLKVGIKKETTQDSDWTIFDNFKLIYKGIDVTDLQNALSALITTAYAIKEEKMGTAESAALNTALDNADATVTNADRLSEMISNLQSAYDAAVPSIDLYATVLPYITKAEGVDASIATTYRNQYDNGTITETAETVFQKLEVATYNYVTNNFAYPVPLSDTWNSTGTNTHAATFSDEHWSGEARSYKNQHDGWGDPKQGYPANSWSIDFDQEVKLPAGEYVFKVAGRKSVDATLELVVTKGGIELGTVNDFPNGNAGLGINKAGAASFDANDPAGFAIKYKDNGEVDRTGYGWQWRYVRFVLDEEATVKVAVHAETSKIYNWVSFGDYTLQMTEETYLEANKDIINTAVAAAEALVNTLPMGDAENTALQNALNMTYKTGDEMLEKTEALNTAVAAANTWRETYYSKKPALVAALERFEADYNDAENGALGYMKTSLWTDVIEKVKAAALAKDDRTSHEGLTTATNALNAALDAAQASIDAYAALKTEINSAKNYTPIVAENTSEHSNDLNEAESGYNNATIETGRANELTAALQNYRVLDYNHVVEAYNVVELTGEWTGKTNVNHGEHWSGDAEATYFDYSRWSEAGVYEATKTVSLPAGEYVLMAAGRAADVEGTEAYIKVNDVKAIFPTKSSYGRGITKYGTATFNADSTYARDNVGYGWEYRFIAFTLVEEAEVTIVAGMNISDSWEPLAWAGVCTPVLYTTPLTAAKENLENAISAAQSVLNGYPVGDGAFQVDANCDAYQGLSSAISTAQGVLNSSIVVDELVAAIEPLNTAVENYKNGYVLNAPEEGVAYNIVMSAGWEYDGKAVTYIANDRKDHGLYNIKYHAAPNANYAQAFTFTPVEGKTNCFTLSMKDVDGNQRYVSTGVPYEGNANQIRTTTDATQALAVKVIATATDGIHQLWNTEANQYIGGQDAGFFTVNSHTTFRLQEAQKAEITLKFSPVGWATLILPFDAELPEGVKAWSCGEANGDVLELVEAESIVANTPYLMNGYESTHPFSGYGLADKDSYTEGLFTGTYVDYATTANSNTYVLQNKGGEVAFYLVGESAQPTVKPYRIYMTYEKAAGAPKFSFGRGEGTTSVENMEPTANSQQPIVVYDLMGRKVTTMEKGNMYIVNGKKVVIK